MKLEFKNLPCKYCKLVIPVKAEFCQYCGRKSYHGKGKLAKLIGWLKDAIGREEECDRNLFALENKLENRINEGVATIDKLRKQIKAILNSLGLEERLRFFRMAFLKFGGGSLKALIRESGQEAEIGTEVFKKMTDLDALVDSKDLQNSIKKLLEMILMLKTGLNKSHDFNVFVPRSHYEDLLDEMQRFLEELSENSSSLSNSSQAMKTISLAISMLQKKMLEYRFIKYEVQIEIWIAEANRAFYQVLLDDSGNKDLISQLDSLKSAGNRFIFKIKEDFSGQENEKSADLISRVEDQLARIEEGRIACITGQALDVIEKNKLINDFTPEENLESLETKVLPPAILLHQTFDNAREEEIRLLSQQKIKE